MWLIIYIGIPIGVVEVKKPTVELNYSKISGQLYDYMMRLKTFYGIKHVFGICTSYEKWRFFWFPESNIYANSDIVSCSFCCCVLILLQVDEISEFHEPTVAGDAEDYNDTDDEDDADDDKIEVNRLDAEYDHCLLFKFY